MEKNNIINNLLKQAEKEMLKLNHPYVGSEHLILALLKDKDIINIVSDYNLSYSIFKNELINIIGKSNIETKTILYTPLLKSIINDAKAFAKENNSEVNSKHLFISILECGDGIGVRILISLGIDLDRIYKELKRNVNPLLNSLNKYSYDLSINDTELINRDNEIDEIIDILSRKNKNNPLLIGDAGVGKTAIVEYIAKIINNYQEFKNYKIYNLDISLILSGSKYRGDFEERLNNIIKEVIDNGKVILFIDEIHTIMKAGGSEGAIDAANILKPYLTKNKLKIIGATTIYEYNKYIKNDKALVRRFDVVYINEPSNEQTRNILYKLKNKYSNYHNVKITKKNINMILDYSSKYLINKKNPDKSIDLLDSVCSYVKNHNINIINKDVIESVLSRKINRKLNINKEEILMKLKNNIYGQDNVLEEIVDIVIKDNNKNILLLGGIGVGKSITVKELSKELSMNFIEIDMQEYSSYYSINNIYSGEQSLYNKLNDNSILLFDNIEKCNNNILDIILKVIEERKIMDKSINNCIIFLSATNKVQYSIGFSNEAKKTIYNNKKVLNIVDYIVNYNEISKDAISKYIEYNNIKDFDYDICDYVNYGFRSVKICMNNKNLIK